MLLFTRKEILVGKNNLAYENIEYPIFFNNLVDGRSGGHGVVVCVSVIRYWQQTRPATGTAAPPIWRRLRGGE